MIGVPIKLGIQSIKRKRPAYRTFLPRFLTSNLEFDLGQNDNLMALYILQNDILITLRHDKAGKVLKEIVENAAPT
ncbi:MAG: hypothetical protein QXW80_06585 [Candidatus Micrarchaeia archaeon]